VSIISHLDPHVLSEMEDINQLQKF
jgi:hypothetical protein